MNREAIKIRNMKQKLWRKYTATRSITDYCKYVRCKNHLCKLTRDLRNKLEKLLANNSKTSPKPFWSYVKSKLKTRTKIPTLKKADGTKARYAKDKAQALNVFFGSVYQQECNIIPPVTKNYNRWNGNEQIQVIEPRKIDWSGWLASVSFTLLSWRILYNKSLIEGVVPSQWLEACITAIHKKGLKSEVGNYRPVSITSAICKIMESIICDHIVTYMSSNKLFSTAQHGFVLSRNCMTNLLLSMEDWAAALEYGYSIDIIYTDFAKAFDSVPHKRLFAKLQSIGVQGQLLCWIEAFLTGRRHRVSISGELSDWTDVTSGTPQGSVLGPILFADNAKLYRPVLSEADTQLLQSDIDNLMEWSSTWQLPFNEMKCKRMHLGRGNNSRPYHMNDHILENVTEEKYLGVIVDHQLKFHTHTSAAIKKANSILGLIKRSFSVKDKSTLPSL